MRGAHRRTKRSPIRVAVQESVILFVCWTSNQGVLSVQPAVLMSTSQCLCIAYFDNMRVFIISKACLWPNVNMHLRPQVCTLVNSKSEWTLCTCASVNKRLLPVCAQAYIQCVNVCAYVVGMRVRVVCITVCVCVCIAVWCVVVRCIIIIIIAAHQ